jgi:hypothetical protein
MGFERKIKRRVGQQITKSVMRKYKEYDAYKIMYNAKLQDIFDELKREWVRETNIHVPRWCQILSLYFPPKVYSKIFHTLWPRECFLKYQNEIVSKPWPRWRKTVNKSCSAALYNVVKFVFHDWLLYCFRYPLRTWGIRRVIVRESHEKVKMDIYYWGNLVYSTTKVVKV